MRPRVYDFFPLLTLREMRYLPMSTGAGDSPSARFEMNRRALSYAFCDFFLALVVLEDEAAPPGIELRERLALCMGVAGEEVADGRPVGFLGRLLGVVAVLAAHGLDDVGVMAFEQVVAGVVVEDDAFGRRVEPERGGGVAPTRVRTTASGCSPYAACDNGTSLTRAGLPGVPLGARTRTGASASTVPPIAASWSSV